MADEPRGETGPMSGRGADGLLTRRQAGVAIGGGVAGAAALAAGLGAVSVPRAFGQPTPPTPRKPSKLDGLMQRGRVNYRTLRVSVDVLAAKERSENSDDVVVSGQFDIQTAAILFPVIESSGSSAAFPEDITSEVHVDDAEPSFEFELTDPIQTSVPKPAPPTGGRDDDWGQGGERYGRWAIRNARCRSMRLNVEIPYALWETRFDERRAEDIEWPEEWPAGLRSCLGAQAGVSPREAAIRGWLDELTGGRDPRSIKPVTLAKYVCAELIGKLQVSGTGLEYDRGGNGRIGGIALEGYELFQLGEVLREEKGPPHAIAAALCSLYRAAGLPARLVLAHDPSGKLDGDDNPLLKEEGGSLVSWVEFCLYDAEAQRELWVPVDPVRLRDKSSRAPDWRKPWRKYFGTHDGLGDVVPIAFHFTPPYGGAVSYGAYGMWGWITTPSFPRNGLQRLVISSITTPRRPGDRDRGR